MELIFQSRDRYTEHSKAKRRRRKRRRGGGAYRSAVSSLRAFTNWLKRRTRRRQWLAVSFHEVAEVAMHYKSWMHRGRRHGSQTHCGSNGSGEGKHLVLLPFFLPGASSPMLSLLARFHRMGTGSRTSILNCGWSEDINHA